MGLCSDVKKRKERTQWVRFRNSMSEQEKFPRLSDRPSRCANSAKGYLDVMI